MSITPSEAEEALATIQSVAKKTRHSIASGGTYISLIITGIIWLTGFMCTQFLSGKIVTYIWVGQSVLGSVLATFLSARKGKRIRRSSTGATARQMALVWLLLAVYCVAAIAAAWPVDGKQLTVFIVLFVMIGYLSMGLLLSFISVWPGLVIIVLMLTGYFLLPDFFYLWMAILGGGGLIALGLYIRLRW